MNFDVFSNAIIQLHSETGGDFRQRFFNGLEMLLPNPLITVGLVNEVQVSEELFRDSINRPVPDFRALAGRFKELVAHEHPYLVYLQRGGRDNLLRTNDLVSQREFERTCLFNEILRPLGIKTQMAGFLGSYGSGGLLCTSVSRDSGFSLKEKEIVSHYMQHATIAFKRDFVRAEARRRGTSISRDDFEILRRRGLTRRECEILVWLVEGKRDREIGIILEISHRTVQTHLRNIASKLGVETRSAMATSVLRLLGRA